MSLVKNQNYFHKYPIIFIENNKIYYTSQDYMIDADWCEGIFVYDEIGIYVGFFDKKKFITMAEYRERRINDILG